MCYIMWAMNQNRSSKLEFENQEASGSGGDEGGDHNAAFWFLPGPAVATVAMFWWTSSWHVKQRKD